MWRALVCAGLAAAASGAAEVATSQEKPGDPIVVGDVAELDLERVRRLTDASDPEVRDARIRRVFDEDVRTLSLHDAVELSLLHNLDLQIARYERDAAAHRVPAARARFHPTTGFAISTEGSDLGGESWIHSGLAFLRQESPTGGTLTLSSDLVRTDLSNTELLNEGSLSVELRQPLMRGGRPYVARREIQDASYEFGIQDAELDAEILRVTRDTKIAYYDSILAARLIDVTAAAVERDERLIEASQALFQAARASRRDVVSAQIRLSDDLTQLAARRAELQQARLDLRDTMGLPLAEVVAPAESSVPFRPVAFRAGVWVEGALARRPEIRQLGTQLEQAGLALRVAGNDVLPKLDLLGLYRRRNSSGRLSEAYDLGNQDWGAALEFEIPFGNVAARQRRAEARARYARAERDLERQRREIEREVRDQVIELRRNLAAVTLQADKVERSREKLELAQARYRLGVANNLDITDAQEDLLDAETDLLTAIFDYTNGLARLEASIAGPI